MMYILQYKGISIVSRVIKFVTRSEVSHTAIEFSNGEVFEAFEKVGVRFVRNFRDKHAPKTPVDVYRLRRDVHEEAVRQLCNDLIQSGAKYSYLNVLRFITRRKPKNDRNVFCSEAVCQVLRKMDYNLINSRVPCSLVSPRDVGLSTELEFVETRVV